ncbi:hypothetical protein H6F67_14785 [Microcoleus sp. FACHB-1515]|uniref:hypothetical protein n=1 Tax=Cyanophyceae TaxID=3028117 RepID=UPI00168995E2|nr:hypothetical protein [Microcoleus sp. FACHB-1515]MBD2091118.1 hypothetical protein [Microcoleus sp. FACHB-1515]
MSHEPVFPIVIVPIAGGQIEESRPKSPPDVRSWQIEAFLWQTGRQTTPSAATKVNFSGLPLGATDLG